MVDTGAILIDIATRAGGRHQAWALSDGVTVPEFLFERKQDALEIKATLRDELGLAREDWHRDLIGRPRAELLAEGAEAIPLAWR